MQVLILSTKDWFRIWYGLRPLQLCRRAVELSVAHRSNGAYLSVQNGPLLEYTKVFKGPHFGGSLKSGSASAGQNKKWSVFLTAARLFLKYFASTIQHYPLSSTNHLNYPAWRLFPCKTTWFYLFSTITSTPTDCRYYIRAERNRA